MGLIMDPLRMVRVILLGLSRPKGPVFRFDARVGLSDIDINLHLTNSRYLYLMDLGRLGLMVQGRIGRELLRRRIAPVIVELDIKYRRELKLGQRYTLDTRVVAIKGKVVELEQTFLVGKRVHARATVRSVLLERGRTIAPDGLRDGVTEPLHIEHWEAVESPAASTARQGEGTNTPLET